MPPSDVAGTQTRIVIEPRATYGELGGFRILFGVLGVFAAAPIVLAVAIDGPAALLRFMFSGVGPFAAFFGLSALAIGLFFMVALLSAGSAFVAGPFRIDARSGATTDAHGRHWHRDRHGPAKVIVSPAGPAAIPVAIIFPGFDWDDASRSKSSTRQPGKLGRFLQRNFARVCLGARGPEVDGFMLPVRFLTDRDAIIAAVKPEKPPFRWF